MKRSSLNHVYRVVWNAALQVWQAVSEVTKGRGKTKTAKSAAVTTLAQLLAGGALLLGGGGALAELPQDGRVSAGAGQIESSGSNMVIRQSSDRMAIDWQSYNIGDGNKVEYIQPSSSSIALNRVLGGDPSQIRGSLVANGRVFLINPNGIVFGERSVIDVAGIVASTLNITNEDFMAGNFNFEGASSGVIVNKGNVVAREGGFVVLIAAKMENVGRLNATGGHVLLGAGQRVRLDLGGPVKIEVDGPVIEAYIKNGGIIQADGGNVVLTVKAADQLASLAINNTGVIQARGIGVGNGGTIRLSASGQGAIENSGTIDASSERAKGGQINIDAAKIVLAAGSVTTASGATAGGDIKLNAKEVRIDTQSVVDVSQRLTPVQTVPVVVQEAMALTNTAPQPSGGSIRIEAESVAIEDAQLDASGAELGGSIAVRGASQTLAGSVLDVSGAVAGGRIRVDAPVDLPEAPRQPQPQGPAPAPTTIVVSNSVLRSDSENGEGGSIELTADELDLLGDNTVSANGALGGGDIKLGGGYQGNDASIDNAVRTSIGAGTLITANATLNGSGGEVIVWADDYTLFEGHIEAKGGAQGGDGGFAEVSGKDTLAFRGTVDLTAELGEVGMLLLDPYNLTISSDATTNISGTYEASGAGSILNVGTLQTALSTANVTVTTGSSGSEAGNITIADSISWGSNFTLTLTAAGSVTLAADKTISSFDGGLTINAGNGLSQGANSRIRIGGNTTLNATAGDIILDSVSNALTGSVSATASNGNITLVNSQQLNLGAISAAGAGKGVVSLTTASGSNASIVSAGTFSANSLNAATDAGGSITIADVNGNLTVTNLTAQGNITLGNTDTGALTLAGDGNAGNTTYVIKGNARFGIYGSGTVTLTGDSIAINDDIRTEGGNIVMVTTSGAITSAASADIVTTSLDGTGTTSGRVDLTAANGMTLNNVTTSGSGNLFGVGANAADVYLTALDGAIHVANVNASGGSAINSYDPTPDDPNNNDTITSPAGTPPNRNGGNAGVVVINAMGDGAGGDYIFLNGNISTAGGGAVGTSDTGLGGYVNIQSAMRITGDREITTGSTVGDVEFDSTLGSVTSNTAGQERFGLTINTGTGNVSMHGVIGGANDGSGGLDDLDFLYIDANSFIELDKSITLNNENAASNKEGLKLWATNVYLGVPQVGATPSGTVTVNTHAGNGTVDINAEMTHLREHVVFTRGNGGIDFSYDVKSEGSEQNNLTFNGANGGVVSIGRHLGAAGRIGDILFSTGTDILIPGQIVGGSFIALNNTGLLNLAHNRSGLGAYQDYNRIGGLQIATTGTANVSANDHNIQIYSNINLSFADAPLSVTATNGALSVSYGGSSNRITIDTQGGNATFTANNELNFLHADMNTRGGDVSLTGNGVYQYGNYWEGSSDINAGSGKIRVDGNGGVITLSGSFTTTDSDTNGTKAVIVQDASTVNINTITAQTGTLRVGEMVGDPLVANVTGNINQSSPTHITGKIDIKTLEAFAGGSIAITSTANVIDTLGDFSLGGSLAVSAIGRAAGMELTGNITATSVSIKTGADAPNDGTLKLNNYNITSTTGDIWLQGAGVSQAAGATINSAGKVTIYGNDYRTVYYNHSDWVNSYKNVDLAGQIIAASTANDAVTFANINGLVLPNMQIGSAGTRGGLRIGVDYSNHIKGAVTQSAAAGKEILVSQVSGYTNNIITLDNALNEIASLGDFQRGGHLTIVDSAGGLNFNGSSWYHYGNNGNSTSNVTISTPGLMALGAHDIRGAAVTLTAGSGLASNVSAITSSAGSYISGGGGTGDVVLDANGSNIVLAGQLDQSNHNNHYSYQDYPGVWGVSMIADGKIIIKDANTVTLANVFANRDNGELVLGQSDAAITGAVITNGEVDIFKLSGYIAGETASLTMSGEFIRQIGDLTAKNGVSITDNKTGLAVAGDIVADNTNAGITLTTTTSGLVANRYFSGYGELLTNTRLSSLVGSSMTSGLGGVALVSDQDIALNGSLTTTGGVTLRAQRVYDPANPSTFRGILLNGNLTSGANGLGLHSGEGVQQNSGVIVTTGAVYGMNSTGQTTQNASNLAARKQISLGMDNEIAKLGAFYLGKYDSDPNPGGNFVVKDVSGGLVLEGNIVNQYQNIDISTAGAAFNMGTYSLTAGNLDLFGKNIKLTGRGIVQDSSTPGSLNVNGTTENRGGTIELVGHDGTTEVVNSVSALAAVGAGDILFYGTLTTKNDSSSAIVIRGAKDVILPNVQILHGDVIKGQLSLGTGTALDEIISGNVSQGVGTAIKVSDLKVSAGGSVVLTKTGNSIEELVSALAGDVVGTDYDFDFYDSTGGLRVDGDVISGGGVRIRTFVDPDASSALSLADSDIKADGAILLQGKGITQTEGGVITANNTVQTPTDTEGGTITLDGGGSILSLLGEVSTNNSTSTAVVLQNASTVTLNTVNAGAGTLVLGGATDATKISEAVTQTSGSVVSAQTLMGNVGELSLTRNNLIDQVGTLTSVGTLTLVDAGGDAGSAGLAFVGHVTAGDATNIKSTDGDLRLATYDLTVGTTDGTTFTGAALTLEGVGISQTYDGSIDSETASASSSAIKSGATTLKGGTGSILLGSSSNDFGAQVTPTATGAQVFIRDANDMTLASLSSISNASPNNTSITAIAGKQLSLNTGALVTDAGSVDLRSLDGNLAMPGTITTGSGNVTLFAAGTDPEEGEVSLNNSITSSSGNISVTGKFITHNSGTRQLLTGGAGTIDVNATGSGGLSMATSFKYQSDAGTVTINSAGPTDLANVITNGALVVRSSGAITQSVSSSSLTANSLDVRATNNEDITLDNANNNFSALTAASRNVADDGTGSGDIRVTDKMGGLSITGITTTGDAVLTATADAVTQTGAIDVGGLAVKGGGSFTLTHASNKLPIVASEATGAVTLSSSVDTSIGVVNPTGVTTGGANFSLSSSAISIAQAINTGTGMLSLTATNGGITQANGLADLTAGSLKLTATGSIALSDTDNNFGTVAAVTTGAASSVTLVESNGFNIATVDGLTGIVTNTGAVNLTSANIGLDAATAVKTNSGGGAGASVTIDGSARVMQNTLVDAGTSSGDVLFKNAVDSTSGSNFGLTVNSGALTRFEGDVGLNSALQYLTTDAGGQVELAEVHLKTVGAQTFNDAVVLTGNTTLTSTGNTILLNAGVDGDTLNVDSVATGAERHLTINSALNQAFTAAVGSVPVNNKYKLGVVTINSAGVTQSTAGLIRADALAINSSGDVVLNETGNNVNKIAAVITSDTNDQNSFSYADADGVTISRIGATAGLTDVEDGEASGSNFTLSVGGLLTQANDALIELDGDLTINTTRNTNLADVTFNNTAQGGTELDSTLISGDFTLSSNGNVTQTVVAGTNNDAYLQVGGELRITGGTLIEGDSQENLLGNGATGGSRADNEIRLNGIVTLSMVGGALSGTNGTETQSITGGDLADVRVLSLSGGQSITFNGSGGDVVLLGMAANSVKGKLKITTAGSYTNSGSSLKTGIKQSSALSLTNAFFLVQESSLNVPNLGSGEGVINLSSSLNNFGGTIAARADGMAVVIADNSAMTLGNITGSTVTLDSGVHAMTQSGVITATNLLVSGAGAVTLDGANRVVTVATATVAGFNFTNAQALSVGTVSATNGITSTGPVVLSADSLAVSQAISAVGQSVTLKPYTLATAINFGGTPSTAGELNLTSADMGRITAGHLIVGSSDAGAITVGAISLASDLSLINNDNISITGALNVGSNDLVINSAGTVTQTAALTAAGLGLLGSGSFTLGNTSNSVITLAGGTNAQNLGALNFVNAGALTVGSVNPVGITAVGAIDISTVVGNLTVNESIQGASVVIHAGDATSAGTSTGGDVIVAAGKTVTASTGNVLIYSGSISGSSGVTTLVGSGSGNFRYNGDENTSYAGAGVIGATGVFAIYREQPTISVTPSSASSPYGDSPDLSGVSGAFSGFVNGDTEAQTAITGTAVYTTTATSTSNAGNYNIAYSTGLLSAIGYAFADKADSLNEYSVVQRVINLSGSRVYNGLDTVDAVVLDNFGNVAHAQTLTLTGVGTVPNKTVGDNKVVSVGSLVLGNGTGLASNYTLVGGTHTLTITPQSISASGITALDKEYDGSVEATLVTSGAGFAGLVEGDQVTLNASGVFADKNVSYDNGTVIAKTVTTTGPLTLSGEDAINYTIAGTTGTITAKITPRIVTLSAAKEYDGTADLTGSQVTIGRLVDGENLTHSGTTASDENVLAPSKFISAITLGNGSGGLASNYALPTLDATTAPVIITAKALTATLANQTKVYDGNTDAVIALNQFGLTGFVLQEGASITKTSGTFNSKDVLGATSVTVTLASGDFAPQESTNLSNYVLPTTVSNTSSTITPKSLTLTLNGLTKVYDGDADFAVGSSDYVLDGFIGAERATLTGASALFNSKNVWEANTASLNVTSSNYVATSDTGMTLSNYILPTVAGLAGDATFSITPKTVQLSATKVYDGSTDLTGRVTINTGIGGESLDYVGAQSSSKDVAAQNKFISNITLEDGTGDKRNYQLPTLDVANASVTINPFIVSFTGTRTYDGTTEAQATDLTLGALVGAETLGLTGVGAVSNKHVADNKMVTITGLTLVDGDGEETTNGLASNYTLVGGTHHLNVTKANLTVTTSDVIKVYDTTTTANGTAVVALGSGTQLFDNDSLSGGTFAFVGKQVSRDVSGEVLSNKSVTVSAVTVNDGNGGANYQVSYVNNTSSRINPATLQVVGLVALDKVYDGTNVANMSTSSASLSGVLFGDDVAASRATGTFADKNVSYDGSDIVAKDVVADTIFLTGADKDNYSMVAVTGLSAKITPLGIRPSVTAESREYNGTSAATVVANLVLPFAGDIVEIGYDQSTALFEDPSAGLNKFVSVSGIQMTGGVDQGNYVLLTDTAVTFADILPRQITVTADDKTRVYGAPDPIFTFTQTRLIEGDSIDVSFDVPRGRAVSVGTYEITPFGVVNPNYEVTYVNGTLRVTALNQPYDYSAPKNIPIQPAPSSNQTNVNSPVKTPLSDSFAGGLFNAIRVSVGDLQLINIAANTQVALGDLEFNESSERVIDQAVAQVATSIRQGVQTRVLSVDGGIKLED